MAFLPLVVGFVGALGFDRVMGDRARAAPATPPNPVVQVAPVDQPAAPALSVLPASDDKAADPTPAPAPAEPSPAPVAPARREAAARVGLGRSRVDGKHVVAPLLGASTQAVTATLTREPGLEAKLQKVLVDGKTPYAATVLLEASTGRIVAIAEHSTRGPSEGLAFEPIAPAASVFKVVTSSALLRAGVSPSATVCTHGGRTRMQPSLLVDDKKRDSACHTLAEALPQSLNVAIAKLALKHLDPDALRAEAGRWGFAAPLPLDVTPGRALKSSLANIPDDPFGFANTAAGFGEVKISALHGAVLASVVANQGAMIPPQLVDRLDGGTEADAGLVEAAPPRRVVSAEIARKLQRMMVDTVASGTARRVFSQSPRLAVTAGGKTGSLADYSTGLDTSWFVGFAPAERPEVIVASVVVNTARWHIKAPAVAKEALRAYFQAHPSTKKGSVVASR